MGHVKSKCLASLMYTQQIRQNKRISEIFKGDTFIHQRKKYKK